jgi:ribosomal protein L20
MANHRHHKMIKLAKGYRNRANRVFSVAKQRVDKARQYAFVGRKVIKSENKNPNYSSFLLSLSILNMT